MNWKQTLVPLVVGLALGIGGTIAVQNLTRPAGPTPAADTTPGTTPTATPTVALVDDYVVPPTPDYFGNEVIPAQRVSNASQEPVFYASSGGETFHRAGCRFLSRIKPDNLITLESLKAAGESGRRPCTTCQP